MAEAESGSLVGMSLGCYRIESLLGKGGMGEVYGALDTELQRRVAIKVVAADFVRDEAFVARFEREARSASAINHPNVAQIYAFGRHQGRPYFVMEFVEGRSLGEVVRDDGRLGGSGCVRYLRQAAEGLQAACKRGIIHRDIKPANLMIDGEARLKIVDFGLARRQAGDAALTRSNVVLGTPAYMAPEQAMSAEVDLRSDIYSLGATFYHLLSGVPPFTADTPIAVMMKHVNETPPPLRQVNPRVPSGVAAVIDRMLAKDPAQRYQSYEALITDVDDALRGRGPRPPAPAEAPTEVTAPVSRPRSASPVSPLVAAIVAIMALAVILATVGYVRISRRVEEALAQPTPAGGVVQPPAGGNGAFEPASPRPTPFTGWGDDNQPTATSAPGYYQPDPGGGPPPGRTPPARPGPVMSPPPAMVPYLLAAARASTMGRMRNLDVAVQVYLAEHGKLPTSIDQLARFHDMHPEALLDGWKNTIIYRPQGRGHYRLISKGPDGIEGNHDDVVFEDGYNIQGEAGMPMPGR